MLFSLLVLSRYFSPNLAHFPRLWNSTTQRQIDNIFIIINPIETMLTTALDTSDEKKNESCQNLKHVNEVGDDFS